jgi:hypothetical protein
MVENDANTLIELRPRNRNGAGTSMAASTSGWIKDDDKVYIEHAVQPTDSLYKIGLQYSVPVSSK